MQKKSPFPPRRTPILSYHHRYLTHKNCKDQYQDKHYNTYNNNRNPICLRLILRRVCIGAGWYGGVSCGSICGSFSFHRLMKLCERISLREYLIMKYFYVINIIYGYFIVAVAFVCYLVAQPTKVLECLISFVPTDYIPFSCPGVLCHLVDVLADSTVSVDIGADVVNFFK